jgi:RNAse (barnase) inhibitor barstar
MKTVHINASHITDWPSFHDAFAREFGFPEFYGRNMAAWMDCMTSLDEEFSAIEVPPGELVCIALDHAQAFKLRCPDQYEAFVECAAFVNWRRLEMGEPAILVLSFRA